MRGPTDITPLTYLDYPKKAACIFWFKGCNLRCPYCYNGWLAACKTDKERTDWLTFLEERKGFLDAVVMSGGESTLHPDIIPVCEKVKELGYLVKIDTNGSNPEIVSQIVNSSLADYVAIDHKMPSRRSVRFGDGETLWDRFRRTLQAVQEASVRHEVRTTCHPLLLDEKDILDMVAEVKALGYEKEYYLQFFFETGNTLGHLPPPERHYDREQLDRESVLPIGYRNFPEDRYKVA